MAINAIKLNNIENMDTNIFLNEIMQETDFNEMPIPSIDAEPHILISKVRKYYFEYIIKLLSLNYEYNNKTTGNKFSLPSAIWRCAKFIEINAARSCMLVELYRRNILLVIKELKEDTENGKLNEKLFEHLHSRPYNDKKIQTITPTDSLNKCSNCQCSNDKRKKQYRNNNFHVQKGTNEIDDRFNQQNNNSVTSNPSLSKENGDIPDLNNYNVNTAQQNNVVECNMRLSVESQDTVEDEVMLQLEHLFRADSKEPEDYLFEGTLCDNIFTNCDDNYKNLQDSNKIDINIEEAPNVTDPKVVKMESLDDRLALIESAGVITMNDNNADNKIIVERSKPKKHIQSKWLCEMYFQKLQLYEKLDEIRETNRKKHGRIKNKFLDLFGEDSDDDQAISPIDESSAFVLSCKERIAPWVVKLLTPYYVKGRIKGKVLFKAVAKHLLNLIYQCSKYPSEYEVCSFVSDFIKNHPLIRCEADFKYFRIDNI